MAEIISEFPPELVNKTAKAIQHKFANVAADRVLAQAEEWRATAKRYRRESFPGDNQLDLQAEACDVIAKWKSDS